MNLLYYVYVSDRGSACATEIAGVIAETLSDLGYQTVFPAPGLPDKGRGRVNVVVAPGEFFPHRGDHSERELLDAARASVTLGVKGPTAPGFDIGARYASVGPMALHMSQDGVDALGRQGINATHLQLGYHPRWDQWGGDPNRLRSTDLLVLGSLTPHGDRILSRAAPLLWGCNAEILLSESSGPMREPLVESAAPSADGVMLASSRSCSTFTPATFPTSTGLSCWRR